MSQFRVYASEGTYIEIDPANLFINNSEGYVEVVALAMGIGVYPVVANLVMAQPVGEMNYTYGQDYQAQGDILYETDGDTYRAQHQFWASDPAPVIYKDGAVQSSGFTVDSIEGTVQFTSPLTATNIVTADYSYTLHDDIAEATAIVAADLIGETSLNRKGMAGLLEIQVAEVRLRRPIPTAFLAREGHNIPDDAKVLLEPFTFRSAA